MGVGTHSAGFLDFSLQCVVWSKPIMMVPLSWLVIGLGEGMWCNSGQSEAEGLLWQVWITSKETWGKGSDQSFPAGCQAACSWCLKLNRPGKRPGKELGEMAEGKRKDSPILGYVAELIIALPGHFRNSCCEIKFPIVEASSVGAFLTFFTVSRNQIIWAGGLWYMMLMDQGHRPIRRIRCTWNPFCPVKLTKHLWVSWSTGLVLGPDSAETTGMCDLTLWFCLFVGNLEGPRHNVICSFAEPYVWIFACHEIDLVCGNYVTDEPG